MTRAPAKAVSELLRALGYKDAAGLVDASRVRSANLPAARDALNVLAAELLGAADSTTGPEESNNANNNAAAATVLRNLLETEAYVPMHILRRLGSQIVHRETDADVLNDWTTTTTAQQRRRPKSPPAKPSPPAAASPRTTATTTAVSEDQPPLSPFYYESLENRTPDPTDEYRDDDDPGYRIRDMWESELVEEIRVRETGGASAALIPYAPAFAALQLPAAAAAATLPDAASLEEPAAAATDAGRVSPSFGAASSSSSSSCGGSSSSTTAPPAASSTAAGEDDDDGGAAWRAAYSDGDVAVHLAQRQAEFKRIRASVVSAASSVSGFPKACGTSSVLDCFALKVVYDRHRTGFESSREFGPKMPGDVIAGRYTVQRVMGRAAFSIALQCFDAETAEEVCLKIIKNDKDFFDQSLDEIKLLLHLSANGDLDRVNILRFRDALYFKEHLILVTELLQDNLYDFAKRGLRRWLESRDSSGLFTLGRLQRVAHQVLVALRFVHSLGLMHLDLKPENVLFANGKEFCVKLIDFGSSCFIADQLSLYVQSRSYRSPEVLLGLPYDTKVDLWSLGCVVAELWTGFVLFQNDSVASLLARIVGILGPLPYYMVVRGSTVGDNFTQDGQLFRVKTEEGINPTKGKRIRLLLPKSTSLRQRLRTKDELFIDFVRQLLQIDPARRPSAAEALKHPWMAPGLYADGL